MNIRCFLTKLFLQKKPRGFMCYFQVADQSYPMYPLAKPPSNIFFFVSIFYVNINNQKNICFRVICFMSIETVRVSFLFSGSRRHVEGCKTKSKKQARTNKLQDRPRRCPMCPSTNTCMNIRGFLTKQFLQKNIEVSCVLFKSPIPRIRNWLGNVSCRLGTD